MPANKRRLLLCFSLLTATAPAEAASYFCDISGGIALGTYRPDGGSEELAITARPPADLASFWFDDATGDYQAYRPDATTSIEKGKLPVPIEDAVADIIKDIQQGKFAPTDEQTLVLFIQGSAESCVAAPIGQLPAPAREASP